MKKIGENSPSKIKEVCDIRKFISILFALVLVLSFSLVMAVPAAAQGNTWYVATDGSDEFGDGTETWVDTDTSGGWNSGDTGPWLTISHAISQASDTDTDTIIVAAGLYVETDGLTIDKPLTLQGAGTALTTVSNPKHPSKTTWPLKITGDNITVEDLTLVGPGSGIILWIDNATGVVIEDMVLTESTIGSTAGMRVETSYDCTFRRITVQDIESDSDAYGVRIYKGGGGHTFEDLTVDGVTGNTAMGLQLSIHAPATDDNSFTGTTITGVTATDGDAIGIDCAKITNNTFSDTEISDITSNNANVRGISLPSNNYNEFSDTRILRLSSAGVTYGIRVDGNDNTFTNTTITTVTSTSASGMACGLYTCEASDLLFDGASISDLDSPNTVRGAYLMFYPTSGCTLHNINVDLTGATPTSGAYGILVKGCVGPITISGNSLSGCTHGIYIQDLGGTGDATNTHCNYNNIAGNGLGVYNDVSGIVDATNNWWGNPNGPSAAAFDLYPVGDAVSDNVDYDPWFGAGVEDSKSEKTKTDLGVTVDAITEADTEVIKKGSGTPTITVSEYTDNPGGDAPSGFKSAGNKYIDVHLDTTENVDEIEIRNYYTLADIAGRLDLDENSLRLSWWNGTTWIECSHSGVIYSVKDSYKGYVWAKIGADTTPDLDDLAGTAFMSMGRTPVVVVGGGEPPPPPAGTTDVRRMVSTAGVFYTQATAISEDRLCQLTIPAGTVGLTEELEPLTTITMLIMADPPPPPEAANVIGLVYDFKPSGATFDPPITLTFSYDPADIPEGVAEEDLVLAYYDEAAGEWLVLDGCQVNPTINTITAPLSHFTAFGVLFIPTPAAFRISGLEVSPAEAEIGDTITITAVVENTGEVAGTCQVALKVNGQVEEAKYVVVDPGASSTVSFTTSREAAGSYSVEINGLVGSFMVTEKPVAPVPPEPAPPAPTPPAPAPPAKPGWLIPVIAISAIIAIAIAVFFIRRRLGY